MLMFSYSTPSILNSQKSRKLQKIVAYWETYRMHNLMHIDFAFDETHIDQKEMDLVNP